MKIIKFKCPYCRAILKSKFSFEQDNLQEIVSCGKCKEDLALSYKVSVNLSIRKIENKKIDVSPEITNEFKKINLDN